MVTTKPSTETVNQSDVRRSLELLLCDGGIVEIRALNAYDRKEEYKVTRTGYFDRDHITASVQAVCSMVNAWHASGVYVTLNPVMPALLARSANKVKTAPKGESTKDAEITGIRWILIDCDPIRPAGISASDEELGLAAEKVKEVGRYLEQEGFARPVIAMSGNGWHLLYEVKLPVEDSALVAQLLKTLDQMFSDDKVKIDTSVFNPSRITKLYGTSARKGDSTPDRPHRVSKLIEVPEWSVLTSRETIESVARQFTPPSHPGQVGQVGQEARRTIPGDQKAVNRGRSYLANTPGAIAGSGGHNHTFTIAKRLLGFGLSSEQVFDLLCEWNAKCEPAWSEAELRHKIESALAANPYPMADRPGPAVSSNGTQVDLSGLPIMQKTQGAQPNQPGGTDQQAQGGGGTAGERFRSLMISAGGLVRQHSEMREALIEHVLRRSEIMNVVASPKVGKSWLVLGLALAVATGGKWLGRFWTKPGRVLLVDNELHQETLAARLKAVAEESGLKPEQWEDRITVVCLRGQTMDLRDIAMELGSGHIAGKFDICIMDAFYRFLPQGIDENSNADICSLYNLLCTAVEQAKLAMILIHHASKGDQSGKGVTDVGSGAGSQSRAADTHLVIRAHEEDSAFVVDAAVRSFPPISPFCMRKTGSLWAIDESLDPKDLKTSRPKRKQSDPSKPSREEIQREKQEEQRLRVAKAFAFFEGGETETKLREKAGMSGATFGPFLMEFLESKRIEKCQVRKGKIDYPGYRLVLTRNSESGSERRSDNPDNSDKSGVLSDLSDRIGGVGRTNALSLESVVQSDPTPPRTGTESGNGQKENLSESPVPGSKS